MVLRGIINHDVFVPTMNKAMESHIPNTINPDATEHITGSRGIVSYDVTAGLTECSGVDSIELVKIHELEGAPILTVGEAGLENLTANLGAEIKLGNITCRGDARVTGSVFGASFSADGKVSAGLAVDKIIGRLSMRLARGAGGKRCLQATVDGQVSQDDIRWTQLEFDLGFPSAIPSALTQSIMNTLTEKLPLGKVIDALERTALQEAQRALGDVCF
jgi:hypothetical protein